LTSQATFVFAARLEGDGGRADVHVTLASPPSNRDCDRRRLELRAGVIEGLRRIVTLEFRGPAFGRPKIETIPERRPSKGIAQHCKAPLR
jgi:hypothetical protein